jgi:hypothetical protein
MAVLSPQLFWGGGGGLELSSFPLDLWQMGGQTTAGSEPYGINTLGNSKLQKIFLLPPFLPKGKGLSFLGACCLTLFGL